MLVNNVHRFVALSKQVGIKGSDPKIKELMNTFRKSGFSSSQISELSGGRWSSTLVRQYTKNWKRVDIELDTQRKILITTLRELVSSNNDIKDVEKYLRLEKTVNAKGSNLQELAELNSILGDFELHPREIGKLVELSRVLLEQGLNPNTLQYWIRLDQELVEDGFNKQVRMKLYELCRENGGIWKVINAVCQIIDLNNIQSLSMRLGREVEQLNIRKEQLENEIYNNQEIFNAAMNAILAGFDTASLIMISVLSKKLGGPYKVADAIQEYQSVNDVKEDLNAKRIMLKEMEREIQGKSGLLSALTYTLRETENVFERNINVQQVVKLLVDPRGLKMYRSEIVEILTLVLDSSLYKIDESIKYLEPPDPIWNDTVSSIKTLAARLHQIKKSRT